MRKDFDFLDALVRSFVFYINNHSTLICGFQEVAVCCLVYFFKTPKGQKGLIERRRQINLNVT